MASRSELLRIWALASHGFRPDLTGAQRRTGDTTRKADMLRPDAFYHSKSAKAVEALPLLHDVSVSLELPFLPGMLDFGAHNPNVDPYQWFV